MIIKGAYVLKSYKDEPQKLDLKISNGKISKISENLIENDEEIYFFDNKLITPGLVNTHTHVAMSIFRGIAEDLPFNEWLFKTIEPLETKLNDEIVYWATLLSLMEMASNGIVAFCDMYMFENSVAKAVSEFGMKALLTRGLVDLDGNGKGRLKETFELIEKWNEHDNRIFVGLGPHAPYSCSINYLKEIANISKINDLVVTMHLFENRWEKEKYNLKEILDTGIADNHFLAVHCVHVDSDDLKLLSKFNTFISHNPTSNLKLGNGIAPITDMLKNEINISFGTDGPASNNSLNVLFEARLATLLQKKDNPQHMKIEDVLKMLTVNGYNALKLDGGLIQEGKYADLTIFDLDTPSFFPTKNMKKHLLHSTPKVYATMVNGKFIYIDGKFPTIDSKGVYRQFTNSYKKVIGIEN
ncbi:MAG: 5-methylthioadenosine/S-adenosylhomocysteine deaminase [Thermosipho sp. (in: thermotogales)]|nr:5-methylthioadenosine/S-adenosylhomocysteine deaminase [Thermosipho sp. (in: thermotogales)]